VQLCAGGKQRFGENILKILRDRKNPIPFFKFDWEYAKKF